MGTLGSEVKTSSFMSDFLEKCGGCAVLDGGFATELERHGADLNDPLWSAKCLISSPHLVRRVHLDYLDAGANIIITASYQATIQGFEAKGFSRDEAKALLRKSVEIAIEAREIYYDKCTKGSWGFVDTGKPSRHPVLVAASVGSYGAYLADGSEYRERVQILANSGADLIAFETIPNKLEAKAYAELLEEESIDIPAWFTFASKDGINVVTSKPIVIYPNSGETYDGQSKQWVPSTGRIDEEFADIVIEKWREAGASLFGGCCRTTPNTIRAISKALSNKSSAVTDA